MKEIKEYLMRELGVSEEEYSRLVEEKRKSNTVKRDIDNIADVGVIQMQMVDALGQVVSMLMDRVTELEGKIK